MDSDRVIRRDLCDCYLGDVPTNPIIIEETKMGHHRSVCTSDFYGFVSSPIFRSFIDLSIHFICRSLQFARARRLDDSNKEFLRWGIPLTVITK